MRAAMIHAFGQAPALADAPEPRRGEGEALLAVGAGALNPLDLLIASGRHHTGAPELPYVAGREGVGRVLEGERRSAGDRVWFDSPAPGSGAFAERVAVPERGVVDVPDGVDDATAAALGIAGLAAWLALEWRAGLADGETVLVLGATGAVGQIAVQAARLLGAGRVVGAGRSAEALQAVRALGADATVVLREGQDAAPALREAAGGRLDVIVDPLWGEPALAALRAASVGARLVQIGQTAAPEAAVPSALVRGKGLSVLGHTNLEAPRARKAAAYRHMAEHAAAGRLRVALEEVALDDVEATWRRQAASPYRKLVLRP